MLSAKRRRFVEEYLVDLNGTQAAIRASYSRNGAEVTASRLLRNVEVAAAVAAAQEVRAERTAVRQDAVVNELALIGFSRISDLFEQDGSPAGTSRVVPCGCCGDRCVRPQDSGGRTYISPDPDAQQGSGPSPALEASAASRAAGGAPAGRAGVHRRRLPSPQRRGARSCQQGRRDSGAGSERACRPARGPRQAPSEALKLSLT
ncbi:MAG: terminase small subunit, partial [SAR202 cluster bacterium]|nr:terminase small subunit [SAR202 cluster bacterium]